MFARGGPREGAGRKSVGETRKISLTLPHETWEKLEERLSSKGGSRSEIIREIIESYFSK
ncbi:ribbon-helix-helix protein, CopG family [Paenibacillus sp. sptzw28]|nr:ribbon-helix-helix protein, CopG family [Paenibacillus sp. sptzw28]